MGQIKNIKLHIVTDIKSIKKMAADPSCSSSKTAAESEAAERSIDSHLDDIGVTSSFLQVVIHVSMLFVSLTVAGYSNLPFFTGFSPPWRCSTESNSSFCLHHRNETFASDNSMFSQRCHLNRTDWTYTLHRTYSFTTEFDLVCDDVTQAAITCSLFHVGSLIGDILAGVFSDAYGRKVVIVVSSLFLPAAPIATGYVNAVWQLCILQLLCGVGYAATFYTCYVYLTEMTPPATRHIWSNIYFLCASTSFMTVDLLAYFAQDWRRLSIHMAIIGIPVWLAFFFIPESPRWLLSKGKRQEAEAVISKIQAFKGNGQTPSPKLESHSGKTCEKSHSYVDLFRHWEPMKVTFCLVSIWFVTPVLYYTISQESMGYAGSLYVNFALTCVADFPSIPAAILLTKIIGRRIPNLAGLFTASLLFGCVALVPGTFVHRNVVVMTLTIIARLTCNVSFIGMFLWSSELYPTVIRSQGFALCTVALKLGMVCVPFMTTVLQAVRYSLPFIAVGSCGCIVALIGIFLPETSGKPTREKFEDFYTRTNVVCGENKVDDGGVDNIAQEVDCFGSGQC